MSQEPLSSKLGGTVEIDEVYLGGKEKGIGGGPANRLSKKVPVISMVERPLVPGQKGKVRSRAVARVTLENLRPMLNEHIERNATLNTDEAVVYFFAGQEFDDHKVVTHKTKQYVRMAEDGKKVTTNTVESFFALLKRGVHGTYHHISKQHLHRYLNEFDFRYNARDVSDAERADRALSGFDGKHLTYRDSCGKLEARNSD